MYITGYDIDGVSQKCAYNTDNYCDNHPMHVVSKDFIVAPHKTFKDFTQLFPALINPENNPNIIIMDKKLNENNLDIMLADEFNEQSQRMRLLTVVSSNINTLVKLKEAREDLQLNLASGSIDFETYFKVLYKVQEIFTPMKKNMLKNIEALKTMSANREPYFYFPIDSSVLPENNELKILKQKTGTLRSIIPVRRNGRKLQVLIEQKVESELFNKMLENKSYSKILRRTGLEKCVVNINLRLKLDSIEPEVIIQGWLSLTKKEEAIIKKIYYNQVEPLKVRFESIVNEMSQWERMIARHPINWES